MIETHIGYLYSSQCFSSLIHTKPFRISKY